VENQVTSNTFLPCLLQKFNKDGSLDNKPGLQVRWLHILKNTLGSSYHGIYIALKSFIIHFIQFKYSFDPSHMQPGEMRQLWKYLHSQHLHIDVWDGDSLLLIGSTSVELKVQCSSEGNFMIFRAGSKGEGM
jgi:hypothetical protein